MSLITLAAQQFNKHQPKLCCLIPTGNCVVWYFAVWTALRIHESRDPRPVLPETATVAYPLISSAALEPMRRAARAFERK